ncbi:hypothetical protein Tco_0870344 [Tanacetum coccineum]
MIDTSPTSSISLQRDRNKNIRSRDHGFGCCSSCWAVEVLTSSVLRLGVAAEVPVRGAGTAEAPSSATGASLVASGALTAATCYLSGPEATQDQVSSISS